VGPDPGIERPGEHLEWQLRVQAAACGTMGSPLYAALLTAAADDAVAGGPVRRVLEPHVAPGRGAALALRFMAAVHRLVLTGGVPELAERYPSAGGTVADDVPERFLAAVEAHAAALADLVALPCQTNEVGRAAALVGGYLDVAAGTGLPLRVLEVGASAGLNLRWDRFRYGGGGRTWGPEGSPVDLTGHWVAPPPVTDTPVAVVERRGCDRVPVDPASGEGRLALTSAVWADQVDRLTRLRGALALAAEVPATVDHAEADAWTVEQLREPAAGRATVVAHSVVEEYLSAGVRQRFREALSEAGARATAAAPLAWLRLEPISALRSHGLLLTTWPGGDERVLARCGAHGTDVRWRPEPA
jgi:hypothetical protein